MKRLTRLWTSLAQELGEQLCVRIDRDLKTIAIREKHEGSSFWTITLPQFSSDFEKALDLGVIETTAFRSFRKAGRAPAFLQGFLSRVFDTSTGVLLDKPDEFAIYAVRQLTLVFKKLELRCTDARSRAAIEAYISCEDELKELDDRWASLSGELDDLRFTFESAFWDVLESVSRDIDSFRLEPNHGPGVTADRLLGNHKWCQVSWPARFEDGHLFPYGTYVLPREGLRMELPPNLISPSDELPVKVILVPKTQKAPRVIAVEPTAMQYMQQGIKNSLVPALEQDWLIGGMVGFTDQDPNREMAREGSITGHNATIDLSEASDRVSNQLVIELCSRFPTFVEGIQATRSRTAVLPDGRKRRLSKFASMGSALCFPVEAMVFTAIALYGIGRARGHLLSRKEIFSLRGKLRVYGDDIIVPVEYATSVTTALETFGLKVNKDKTFSGGKFRESCGGDYYNGEEVTPLRLRHLAPSSAVREDSLEALENWVSLSNAFYKRGLWKTAEFLADEVRKTLGSSNSLPVVPENSQALGLHSFMGASSGTRMSPTTHNPQVKAWIVRPVKCRRSVDGYWALRKCFAGDYADSAYAEHLTFSGRPSGAKLIRKWVDVDEMSTLGSNES